MSCHNRSDVFTNQCHSAWVWYESRLHAINALNTYKCNVAYNSPTSKYIRHRHVIVKLVELASSPNCVCVRACVGQYTRACRAGKNACTYTCTHIMSMFYLSLVSAIDLQTRVSHWLTNTRQPLTHKHASAIDSQTRVSHWLTNTRQPLTHKHASAIDSQTRVSHWLTNTRQPLTYKHASAIDSQIRVSH